MDAGSGYNMAEEADEVAPLSSADAPPAPIGGVPEAEPGDAGEGHPSDAHGGVTDDRGESHVADGVNSVDSVAIVDSVDVVDSVDIVDVNSAGSAGSAGSSGDAMGSPSPSSSEGPSGAESDDPRGTAQGGDANMSGDVSDDSLDGSDDGDELESSGSTAGPAAPRHRAPVKTSRSIEEDTVMIASISNQEIMQVARAQKAERDPSSRHTEPLPGSPHRDSERSDLPATEDAEKGSVGTDSAGLAEALHVEAPPPAAGDRRHGEPERAGSLTRESTPDETGDERRAPPAWEGPARAGKRGGGMLAVVAATKLQARFRGRLERDKVAHMKRENELLLLVEKLRFESEGRRIELERHITDLEQQRADALRASAEMKGAVASLKDELRSAKALRTKLEREADELRSKLRVKDRKTAQAEARAKQARAQQEKARQALEKRAREQRAHEMQARRQPTKPAPGTQAVEEMEGRMKAMRQAFAAERRRLLGRIASLEAESAAKAEPQQRLAAPESEPTGQPRPRPRRGRVVRTVDAALDAGAHDLGKENARPINPLLGGRDASGSAPPPKAEAGGGLAASTTRRTPRKGRAMTSSSSAAASTESRARTSSTGAECAPKESPAADAGQRKDSFSERCLVKGLEKMDSVVEAIERVSAEVAILNSRVDVRIAPSAGGLASSAAEEADFSEWRRRLRMRLDIVEGAAFVAGSAKGVMGD